MAAKRRTRSDRRVRAVVIREARRQTRWDYIIEGTVIVVASLVVLGIAAVLHL
ncbi:MAG TPA: hypothetical protein VGS23_00350 [Thermoplasmata archaeon]|nr:hypothetical protein [Thermoplasmata archaeon]